MHTIVCCVWIEIDTKTRGSDQTKPFPWKWRIFVFQPAVMTHIPLMNLHLAVWQQRNIILLFLISMASLICCASDIWQLNTVLIYNATLFCTEKPFETYRSRVFSSILLASWADQHFKDWLWRFQRKKLQCRAARWEWTAINIGLLESS